MHHYHAEFLGPKHRVVSARVKSEPFSVQKELARKALGTPVASNRLVGTRTPSQLGMVARRMALDRSEVAADELTWVGAVLCTFASELQDYVRAKSDFDHALYSSDQAGTDDALVRVFRAGGASLSHYRSSVAARYQFAHGSGDEHACVRTITEELGAIPDLSVRAFASICVLQDTGTFTSREFATYFESFFQSAIASNPNLPQKTSPAPHKRLTTAFHANVEGVWDLLNETLFDEALAYVLWDSARLGIVDLYETYVTALVKYCARAFPSDTRIRQSLAELSSRVLDPRLRTILTLLDPSTFEMTSEEKRFLSHLDVYTQGEATNISSDKVISCKSMEFAELVAKHALRHGISTTGLTGFHCDVIDGIRALEAARLDQAGLELERLAVQYQCTAIGRQLLAYVRSVNNPGDSVRERERAFSAGLVTPRLARALGRERAKVLLQRFRTQCPNSPTVELFERTTVQMETTELTFTLPPERVLKYRATTCAIREEYDRAVEVWAELRDLTNDDAYSADATRGLFACLVQAGRADEAAEVGAQLIVEDVPLVERIDLVHLLSSRKAPNSAYASWVTIAAHLEMSGKGNVTDHDVYLELIRFLEHFSLSLPTENLESLLKFVPNEQQGFFLKAVLRLDVIQYLLDIPSYSIAEDQRLSVLGLLQQMETNPGDKDIHRSESMRILQNRLVRDTLRTLDDGKVFVDTVGITNEFLRTNSRFYQLYRELDDEPLGSLTLPLSEILGTGRKTGSLAVVGFTILFESLRDRYVASDAHGLDSYLGVRIRHGKLEGTLRAPLDAQDLLTKSIDGEYEPNFKWTHVLGCSDPYEISEVNRYFRNFSRAVDETIAHAKDNLVQIRKRDDDPVEALLDFRYGFEEMNALYAEIGIPSTLEEFVEQVLLRLRQRTEDVLKNTRETLRTFLTQEFKRHIDNLEVNLSTNNYASPELTNAISQCRTDVQYAIAEVNAWLTLAQSPSSNRRLAADTLVSAIVEGIRLRMPKRHVTLRNLDVGAGISFDAASFHSIADVFDLLLSNAFQYGDADDPAVDVKIVQNSGCVDASVSNALLQTGIGMLSPRKFEDRAKGELRSDKVRGAGGTGAYKLGKLLRVDLNQGPDFHLTADTDSGRFEVSIRLDLTKLKEGS